MSKTNTFTNWKYKAYILMIKKYALLLNKSIAWFERYLQISAFLLQPLLQSNIWIQPKSILLKSVWMTASHRVFGRPLCLVACLQSYRLLGIWSVSICCIRPNCWYFLVLNWFIKRFIFAMHYRRKTHIFKWFCLKLCLSRMFSPTLQLFLQLQHLSRCLST